MNDQQIEQEIQASHESWMSQKLTEGWDGFWSDIGDLKLSMGHCSWFNTMVEIAI